MVVACGFVVGGVLLVGREVVLFVVSVVLVVSGVLVFVCVGCGFGWLLGVLI